MVRKVAATIIVWSVIALTLNAQKMEVYPGQNYYTGEKQGRVIVLLKGVNDGSVELFLGNKKITTSQEVKEGRNVVEFPLKDLKDKDSKLKCVLSAGGKKIESDNIIVRRLPPKTNAVKIDNITGGLIVDEKPFFPFGFYCYSKEDAPQPFLAENEVVSGFNMMSPYQSCDAKFMNNRKVYMDNAAKYNMKVHYNLLGPVRDAAVNRAKLAECLKFVTREVKAFRDHSALLGWYISDEPELRNEKPDVLREIYLKIKELDPYHPITIVFISAGPAQKYKNCLDIVMTDPYPIPNRGPNNAAIAPWKLKSQFRYKKPIWTVPQAFGGNEHWGREPTKQELRLMTYRGIQEGSTGVQAFIRNGYNGFPKSTETWHEYAEVARGIAELSPDILSDEQAPGVASLSPKHIKAAVWLKNNRITIMLANLNNQPSNCSVKLKDITFTGKALCPFENRQVDVKNGAISDMIDAYGTRVYQFNLKTAEMYGKDKLKDKNLIRNSSFESSPSTSTPSSCYVGIGDGRGVSYFVDSIEAAHGRHSLRIHVPDEKNIFSISPYAPHIAGGQDYIISVWAKAKKFPATGKFPTLEINVNGLTGPYQYSTESEGGTVNTGKKFKVQGSKRSFTLTENWKKYTIPGTSQKKFKCWFNFAIKTPGTVWLDAMSFSPNTGSMIGTWTPEQLIKTESEITWDVTKVIKNAGSFSVVFSYKKGKQALVIKETQLLEDGKAVATDVHNGFTGWETKNNRYKLNLKTYIKGKKYSIKVIANGSDKMDSFGDVYLKENKKNH